MGTRVFIVVCMRNAKSHVSNKQGILATQTPRDWNESRANCLARLEVLSCNALAGVTLYLPLHASHVCHSGNLPVASQLRDPVARLL